MGVPRSHHTKSRRNKGRSHFALKLRNLSVCSKCGKAVLAHTICRNCGFYGGREVIDVLAKLEKKEKKKKAKELAEQEKETRKEKPLSMEELSRK